MKNLLLALCGLICSFNLMATSTKKTVTVFTTVYPPYVVQNSDGSQDGVSLDILRVVFGEIGYQVNFEIAPYRRTVKNLFSSENHIMMGMFVGIPNYQSIEATEVTYMVFPTTYFYNHQKNPQYAEIKSLKQTTGKMVSIMGGTGFYENVIKESGGILAKVSNEVQVLSMVKKGRVDFGHTGNLTGLDRIKQNKAFAVVRPLDFNVTEIKSGLVFRKGAFAIRDKFIKKIEELHKNGRMKKIYGHSLRDLPLANPAHLVPDAIGVNHNTPKAKAR